MSMVDRMAGDRLIAEISGVIAENAILPDADVPTIGLEAAQNISICAEQTARDVEAAIQTARVAFEDLEAAGADLAAKMRGSAKGYEEQIQNYTKMTKTIALSMRTAAGHVSKFGGQ